PGACPEVVLPQSSLPPPHFYRTPAHSGRPRGPTHAAAGPAPRGPRRGPGGHGWGAPRPRVGPRREPERPAARAAPTAAAGLAHAPCLGGGRFRLAQRPDLWHRAHRFGAPPARRFAPGPRG